ncbi:protein MFI isoform X3 [Crotalus tigris]|uniref:protein MFI isoform X3 n=1 Tax=Crotalus tigris TaxID=88082 RepID=UPI00192F5AA2|nr:protein MFI isoform X3 [Crotalus tigris]
MQDDYKKNYGNSGKRIINPKNVIELFRDKKEEKKDKAAHVIQKTWRRWLAEFLDAAAGVHIKFRLGGEKFPPSIYYKIFTHRPIVDLCANSPKDYAKMATQPNPRKLQKGSVNESTSDWYQRIENNGWRLLSIRYWKGVDSLTTKDNTKIQEFHHSPQQRKRNMVKRRKARKIEWLKKMYFGENLQVKTENPEAIVLIQRATEGLIKSLEKEGIDQVMEWEVDEMLKWTNALNYDEYVKLWKEVGTSKTSESFQAFRFTQQDNIYELIPNKIQEIMQSHLKKKK